MLFLTPETRRQIRWAVAALCAVSLLVALGVAGFQQWERRWARDAVLRAGGSVVVQSRWPEDLERRLPESWRGLAWDLQTIAFNDRSFTTKQLRHLAGFAGLRSVRSLYLNGTGVDDESLRALHLFTSLEQLYLEDTAITDEGLQELAMLPRLRIVSLRNTRVTPDGIDRLHSCHLDLQILGSMNMRPAQDPITDGGE